MTDSGILQMVQRRDEEAGSKACTHNQFRHSFAHQWLSQGGQETDLMRLAGLAVSGDVEPLRGVCC